MLRTCCSDQWFRKNRVELTPHRKIVFRILTSAKKALTPKDILKEIHRKAPMDKVTLYRILDLFVKKRIIRRITGFQGFIHYEINCEEHYPLHPHFVCRDCGDIECLNDLDLSGIRNTIKRKRRIQKEDIDLKLEGVCAKCQ